MSAHAVRPPRFGPGALATRANAITLARLVLAMPLLILIWQEGASWLVLAGWVVLGATDGLDGYIARRDGTTRSGAFLDPIADKILTLGGLVALALRGSFGWVPVLLIAGRELFISAYRAAAGRRGISLPARRLGKYKAILQLLAVGSVILPPLEHVGWLHQTLLWSAVARTFVSGADIVRQGWRSAQA